MKKLLFIFMLVALLPVEAMAKNKPSGSQKAEAGKWLIDFRAEKDKSLNPDVMNNAEQRRVAIQNFDRLQQRATTIFKVKQFHPCAQAAGKLSTAWQAVDNLMTAQVRDVGYSLGIVLSEASDSAQWYSDCQKTIDNLK